MRVDKALVAASAFLVAAAPQGSFEVVKSSSSPEIISVVAVLATVTSLTFIALLLACGLRKPLL